MRYRDLEVGPSLSGRLGDVFLGYDPAQGLPLALRRFSLARLPEALPVLPLPAAPSRHLARALALHSGPGEVVSVSELALGPTLDSLLASGPQPPSVVAGLAAQALEGLVALHAAGLAHGRIHPGNLVLDVDQGCLRIVDLCAGLLLGLPRGRDGRKIYARPGLEAPTPEGDVYAVGRVAEALLRGGDPLGAWSPLGLAAARRPRSGAGQSDRFEAWVGRCQALGPADRFADAAAALAALQALGEGSQQAVAQVRAGRWAGARRRALRALARFRAAAPSAPPGVEALSQAVSSLRAAGLWRGVAFGAAMAFGLSLLLASRPRSSEADDGTAGWSEDACLDAARSKPVTSGAAEVDIVGTRGAKLAIDGCPVRLTAEPTRVALAPGRHVARVALPDRTAGTTFELRPKGSVRLSLPDLPVATRRDDDGAHDLVRELSALTPEMAPVPPDSMEPAGSAALDGFAARALALARAARRPELSPALEDDLALTLDGLWAAGERLASSAGGCDAAVEKRAREALSGLAPSIDPKTLAATGALAASRLFEGLGDRGAEREREVLSGLGLWDGPLLERAVADVVGREDVARCRDELAPAAQEVDGLAERAVVLAQEAQASSAWATPPPASGAKAR
ncbi:MAG: protein kinase family protein [Deltaproteobacteria bacterium]